MAARGGWWQERGEGETESNFQVSLLPVLWSERSPFCALFSVSSTTEQTLDWKCGSPSSSLFAVCLRHCVYSDKLDSTCVSAFIPYSCDTSGTCSRLGKKLKLQRYRKKMVTESSFSLSLYWIWGIDTEMYNHRKWKQTLWPNTVLGLWEF